MSGKRIVKARPHPDAVGLSAFRVLKNGQARQYSAVEFYRGWQGVERTLRRFTALGMLVDADGDEYAVLDVLSVDEAIVQDFGIRDARAFQYIKRHLGLTVEPSLDALSDHTEGTP